MAKSDQKSKGKTPRPAIDNTPVTTDPRFSSVHSDPRFNIPRRNSNRTVIDERFRPILEDDAFARSANVDRYGRKLKDDKGRDTIRKLYEFEGDEDEDEDGEEEDSEEEARPVYDPARGEGLISSSEEEDSEDEEEVIDPTEAAAIAAAEREADGIPLGDITKRIAVVNLDWDHVRAVDLMATFMSFVPEGGKVENVVIYPSEFGKERMEREEMEGPPRELFVPVSKKKKVEEEKFESMLSDDDEEEDDVEAVTAETIVKEDKGEEVDSAKLRNYQLERLRYFYAVVTCSSPTVANSIYTECDGVEYEATANFFDLRFVPDDVTFDDTPRDECDTLPKNYKPNEFVTDALRASKVKLTWDQDDGMRKQAAKEAFSRRDIEDMDLKAYLASDSSENESDGEGAKEDAKRRYRELLNLSGDVKIKGEKEKKPVGDMEVTFTSALSWEVKLNSEVFEKDETTLEKYQRKERERRQARKDKFKAKKGGVDTEEAHFSAEHAEHAAAEDAPAEELGFDDPFFEVDAQPKDHKSEKKKDRLKRREEKAAAAERDETQRAELEAIMTAEAATRSSDKNLQHYDMKSILRAEKAAKLKGKAAKRAAKKGVNDAEGLQDNYEIDVQDPRLEKLYKDAEFAIDPTNPRFKKTVAMEKVLKEKRRRRTEKGGTEREEDEEERRERKKRRKIEKESQRVGLDDLVRRLKSKAQR